MTTPTQTPKRPNIQTVSAGTIAVTGALVWVLQTYVFHHALPSSIYVAINALAPALVGGLFTRHALKQMPPNLDKAIAARWDKKFHASNGTRVVPNQTVVNLPFTAENPTGKDDNPFGGAA